MTGVIRPDLEKREPGKRIILLDEKNHDKGLQNPGTILIEPGGIVQVRYRARRIGARITKAVANEVPGDGRGPAIGKGKRFLGSVKIQNFGRKK
jgi:hypothetical protein